MPFPLPSPMQVPAISALLNEREQSRRILSSSTDANPAHSFSVAIGSSDENQGKNRYRDIIAYDRTLLKRDTYVNASLIREPDMGIPTLARRHWIAAQAPLPETIFDFYSILFALPCSAAEPTRLPPIRMIVQLTALVEGGRRKAHPYFPKVVGETAEYRREGSGDFVRVRLVAENSANGSIARALQVTTAAQTLAVSHHEYIGWGDHGVPSDSAHLVKYIESLNLINDEFSSPGSAPSPILIHCSAGVGRTGTYIALSSLLSLRKAYSDSTPTLLPISPTSTGLSPYPADQFDVPREFVGLTIDGIRDQRTTMVQTESQIAFIYDTLRSIPM